MWTLRRTEQQDEFADEEGVLIEWFTLVMALVALIGVLGLCLCPYLETPERLSAYGHSGTVSATGAYPFLADLAVLRPGRDEGSAAAFHVAAAPTSQSGDAIPVRMQR